MVGEEVRRGKTYTVQSMCPRSLKDRAGTNWVVVNREAEFGVLEVVWDRDGPASKRHEGVPVCADFHSVVVVRHVRDEPVYIGCKKRPLV